MENKFEDFVREYKISDEGIMFFKAITRLEFSIKDCGFSRRRGANNDAAEVDWDRYVKERLGPDFLCEARKISSIKPLIENPPKQQIIQYDGCLDWKDAASVLSSQDVIGALRRVRNNLLHGGKSGHPDSGRNQELYIASLAVIDLILGKDEIAKAIFYGEY